MSAVFFTTQDSGLRIQSHLLTPGLVSTQPSTLLHSSLRPLYSGAVLPDSIRQTAPDRGRKNGMTLIELVAALSLMVVIIGILMTVLNSATNLWGSSRNRKKDLTAIATSIADLIADDLYQAMTDISEQNDLYQSFYCYSPDPTNIATDTVTIHLAFLRPASPRTHVPPQLQSETRTSLDAIFYTTYSAALYRHVLPVTLDFTQALTNGIALPHNFLTELMPLVNDPELHRKLLDPYASPPETSSALLAERVIATFLAHYRDDPDPKPDDIQSDLLPHYLDLALHLFNAEDWDAYRAGINDYSKSAEMKRSQLGTLISRRITLPQAGGSRLP